MEVPDIKAFNTVLLRLEKVEMENEFLRQLVLGQNWLSQKQAHSVLGVSEPTLISLRRKGELAFRSENRRFFYGIDSVRNYLLSKKIEPWAVNSQVLSAFKSS